MRVEMSELLRYYFQIFRSQQGIVSDLFDFIYAREEVRIKVKFYENI